MNVGTHFQKFGNDQKWSCGKGGFAWKANLEESFDKGLYSINILIAAQRLEQNGEKFFINLRFHRRFKH